MSIFNQPTMREDLAHDLRPDIGAPFTPLLPRWMGILRGLILLTVGIACLVMVGGIAVGISELQAATALKERTSQLGMRLAAQRSQVDSMSEEDAILRNLDHLAEYTPAVQALNVNLLRQCAKRSQLSLWNFELQNPLNQQYLLTLHVSLDAGNPTELVETLKRTALQAGWRITSGPSQFSDTEIKLELYVTPDA